MTEVGRSICSRLWPIPLTHVSCVLMACAGFEVTDSIVQQPKIIKDERVTRGGRLVGVVSGLCPRPLCAPQTTFLAPPSLGLLRLRCLCGSFATFLIPFCSTVLEKVILEQENMCASKTLLILHSLVMAARLKINDDRSESRGAI